MSGAEKAAPACVKMGGAEKAAQACINRMKNVQPICRGAAVLSKKDNVRDVYFGECGAGSDTRKKAASKMMSFCLQPHILFVNQRFVAVE